MDRLAFASIAQLRQLLAKKEISAPELLDFFIQRFHQFDPILGSALEIFDTSSIMANWAAQGPLEGIPGLIKDNICQQGRIASCGSKILQHFRGSYDATVTARLKEAGALIVGRANMDEFAMGSSTETSAFGRTVNPWDITRVPGGSSGGSAAAVAAGLVPWALGTETGGSARQPAALCGIVSLKPTYGLVSRYGLVAYASSFDQICAITRTVDDNARIFSVIAGHDTHDSSSLPGAPIDYTQCLNGKIKPGLKIGIIENAFNAPGIDPEVQQVSDAVVKQLEALGATMQRITLPALNYGAAIYFILSRAQAASNLARFDGVRYGYRDNQNHNLTQMYADTRGKGFGSLVKARILIGNYVLSVGHANDFYVNARKAQALMRQEFMQAFTDVDLLLAPTTGGPAFKLGAFDNDPLQMALQDYFTCPMNIIGIPAISVPCGFTAQGLPLGIQFIGPDLSEGLLFQTAYAYEQQTPWHTMRLPMFDKG